MGEPADPGGGRPVAAPARPGSPSRSPRRRCSATRSPTTGIPVVSRLALTARGGDVRGGDRPAVGARRRGPDRRAGRAARRPRRGPDDGAHRRSALTMDPAAMLQVEEQRPGVLEVELVEQRRRGVLGLATRAGRAGARRRSSGWPRPLPLALEMLAAHVQPNHPAVTALVGRGRRAPRASGPAARAVEGYQSGPERVDEIVAAIAEAVQPAAASATASRRPAGPTSASRCARRATSSPGGSARRWTPSSCSPPRWSRPASGRCCGWPSGHAVPRLLARGAQRRERRHHRRRRAWSTCVDLGLIRLVETTLLTAPRRARPPTCTARPTTAG